MKELYSFILNETEKEEGKPAIPHKIILKWPSREEKGELEEEYARQVSRLTLKGIWSREMLLAKYEDANNGIFSQKEVKNLVKLYIEYRDTENERIKLTALTENVDVEKKGKLEEKLVALKKQITSLEREHADVFDTTAEAIAQKKTVEWCILNLTYVSANDSKPVRLFEGETDSDKLKWLSEREEKGDNYIINTALDRILFNYHIWFIGLAKTPEDFKKMEEVSKPKTEDKV